MRRTPILLAVLLLATAPYVAGRTADDPLATLPRAAADPLRTAAALVESESPAPAAHCHGAQNPHRYNAGTAHHADALERAMPVVDGTGLVRNALATAAQALPEDPTPLVDTWVLASRVALRDGAIDCEGQGADIDDDGHPDLPMLGRAAIPDGDPEFGIGGGFFPASHHGNGFEVADRAGRHVAFTVASDADGDGLAEPGECRERFVRRGETSCPPGADGGWWVVLHADATSAPTTGVIVSGPVSAGSQLAQLPMLASVLLTWDGDTQTFSWSSPGGWDCALAGEDLTIAVSRVSCTPPQGFSWSCQNHAILVQGWHIGGAASQDVNAWMECGTLRVVSCMFVLSPREPVKTCGGSYGAATYATGFTCALDVIGNARANVDAQVECFNDP